MSEPILKRHGRFFFDPEIEKASAGDLIRDISRCGMFIETSRAFSAGEKIRVEFEVLSSRKSYKILGEIVRFQKKGIGVKFSRRISVD